MTRPWRSIRVGERNPWFDVLAAATILAAGTLAMLPFRSHLNLLNLSLFFLIIVVAIALFARRGVSAGAAICAFLVFDYLFIRPYYTFSVARSDHVLALFVFLGAALLTSQLIYRLRSRTVEALRHGQQMATLNELSAVLIADIALEPLLATIVERVVAVTGVSACAILLPDDDQLVARAAVGPLPDLDSRDEAALARFAFEQREPSGVGRGRARLVRPGGSGSPVSRRLLRQRSAELLYLPIATASRSVGVLRVSWPLDRGRFTLETRQLLATFANQAALAIERVRLVEEATRSAILQRSDELKSALLSAVSHDLRTPLASIKASVTSLLQDDVEWSEEDERDLLQAIDEETDRLTRIVGNLLDLSRIEAGVLQPERAWSDLHELFEEVVNHQLSADPTHLITCSIECRMPNVFIDYVEMCQVLTNLLDNAAKYSSPGTSIEVSAERTGDRVVVSVADRGPGIPLGEEDRIFEKFYRITSRRGAVGTGIGLSICRGIIEAHGGHIWAEQRHDGGSIFRFTLPIGASATGRERTCEYQDSHRR